MSAMRILMSAIFLASLLASPASAVGADSKQPVDVITEPSLGALAPGGEQLDMLYAKLKKERGVESARLLADEIRETITLSGSATVDMLMASAGKALTDKRYGAALDFLDQVTLIAPDYAEGWNRRATAHFLMGNYPKSMTDIAHTLKLEPRHLGALAGLAGMLQEKGRDAQALKVWEIYLGYYPADRDAQKQALDLTDKLAGQKT
jgi:tetratricopeptide (TPR) repeat protein